MDMLYDDPEPDWVLALTLTAPGETTYRLSLPDRTYRGTLATVEAECYHEIAARVEQLAQAKLEKEWTL